MMTDFKEGVQPKTVELSEGAGKAIAFVLSYQPYKCYDAAPRIKAVLLRDGINETSCTIFTTPSSRHYWVQMGYDVFSTVDISTFRESPITNERTHQLEKIAKEHAESDSSEAFDGWVYDENKELLNSHQKIRDAVKTYSDRT